MPRFHPFPGLRYALPGGGLDSLVAPPYDVISPMERERLAKSDEHNAVRVEVPVADDGAEGDVDGGDRYRAAARIWGEWREAGALVADAEASFYVYRMGFHGEDGRARQTTGIIGALELSRPGEGGVLPHEQTTAKDKADRLDLLRACRANLSPVWGLTTASGLSALCEVAGPPVARATDEEGVHHRLWRVSQRGTLEAISGVVASAPVLIADGHHRYETALAYRDERGRSEGAGTAGTGTGSDAGAGAGAGAVMAYVVELSEDQLDVRPIHRLVSGLPAGVGLPAALAQHFDVTETSTADESMPGRMAEAGALGLVTATGTWLLRPRPPTAAAAAHDLDSSRLDVALADLPPHELRFQHGVGNVVEAVASGQAQAGVLLRPATVAQIAAIAGGGERMPPKTTFFYPKPRTGMVFRSLD
ncbi:MAG TPA: DUF1015 domain-containing protein [Acidimicrobiales bacterium]|nr:DUF1015 domain-containing protein [Acidimicrobiales bacterium]